MDAPQNILGKTGFGSWSSGIRWLWDELTGRNQQREQNEWNRQQSLEAYQRDVEMWNAQNDYNSPSSQMQRYQAAGLNPNLIYSSGNASAGNASGHPSYQPAQGVGRPSGIETLSRVANVISMLVGLKGQLASADAAAARAKNLLLQSPWIGPLSLSKANLTHARFLQLYGNDPYVYHTFGVGYDNYAKNRGFSLPAEAMDPMGVGFDRPSSWLRTKPGAFWVPAVRKASESEYKYDMMLKYQDAVQNANLIHTQRINSLLQQQNSFYKLDKLIGYGTDIFSSLVSLGKFGLDAKKFKYITNY